MKRRFDLVGVALLVTAVLSPLPASAQWRLPTTCTVTSQNLFVRDVMTDIYFWYDQIPPVNPVAYPSPEAYLEAVEDGVKFCFLTNPERFDADGRLTCRVMELGTPDEKGRRRPLATEETVTFQMDALITAIGEPADTDAIKAMGVPLDGKGWPIVDAKTGETARSNVFLIGDVQKGPSSIVAAIGEVRRGIPPADPRGGGQ